MSRTWLVLLALAVAVPATAGPRRHVPPEVESLHAQSVQKLRERITMAEDLLSGGAIRADHPRHAEMLFRLAEMYNELARVEKLDAFRLADQACQASPEACLPSPDLQPFEAAHDRALTLYQLLIRRHPRYERLDEARFALAIGLLERDRVRDAHEQLRQYVRFHAEASQGDLAWLQLGELELDDGDALAAATAFRKASRFRDSPYRATAEHRLGWALRNLGEDREALAAVRRAVQLATASGDMDLVEEGRRDLVRFAVELGALDEVEGLLGMGDDRVRALTLAARTHAEQGQVDAAVQVWRRVITEAPEHPSRPAALAAIAGTLRTAGRWEEALAAARRLELDHRPGTTWARANAMEPPRITQARASADQELRRIATAAHTEARKLGRRGDGERAAAAADHAYDAWLDAFGTASEDAPEVHRAYGELLYEREAWAEAFAQYEQVWTLAPGTPAAREAARSALFAAEKLLDENPAPAPAEGVDLATVQARPLTEHEQRLLTAVDAALTEGTDREAAVVYRAAYVLYGAFHFEEAGERFRRVIALDPRSKDAERAAHLIADMLAVRESWEALATNAAFYAQQDGLGTAAFRRDMATLARKAELKAIEARVEADDDRHAAAVALLAWVDRHGADASPEVLSVAFRDAAAHHEAAGDLLAAAQVRQAFLARPRLAGDAHRRAQWLALGDDHERLARWSDAARAYGSALTDPGTDPTIADDDPRLAEAAWRRALLLQALERPETADAFTAFLDLAGADDPRRPLARLHQARTRSSVPAWAALLDDTELPVHARVEAAIALHALGRPDALERGLDLLPSPLPDDDPELADRAGEARFLATEAAWEAFRDQRIVGLPGAGPRREQAHFKRQIAELQRDASALGDACQAVIRTRSGPWGLAAATRLGEIQEAWAHLLRTSDTPRHLTPGQAELYRQALEDIAWMREEDARTAYARALDRAFDLPLYTEATRTARERLARLDPESWPPQHETVDVSWHLAGGPPTVRFEEEL